MPNAPAPIDTGRVEFILFHFKLVLYFVLFYVFGATPNGQFVLLLGVLVQGFVLSLVWRGTQIGHVSDPVISPGVHSAPALRCVASARFISSGKL